MRGRKKVEEEEKEGGRGRLRVCTACIRKARK